MQARAAKQKLPFRAEARNGRTVFSVSFYGALWSTIMPLPAFFASYSAASLVL